MKVTTDAIFFGDYESIGSSELHLQTMSFDGSHTPHRSNLFGNYGSVDPQYEATVFGGGRRSHHRGSNNLIGQHFNMFDDDDDDDKPLKNGGFVISRGGYGRGGGGGGGGRGRKGIKNKKSESSTPSNVIDFVKEKSHIVEEKRPIERRKQIDRMIPEIDDLMIDITQKLDEHGDMYKELRSITALRLKKERQARKGWKQRKEQDKREKLAMEDTKSKKDKEVASREDV